MLGVGYLLPMNQRDESTIVEVDGKGETWAKTSGLELLRLAVQWLPNESGDF